MEDYIDALLEYLSDRRNAAMSFASAAQLAREEEAFEALSRTFTEEQRRLFHAYDDARTAFAAASEDAYVRQVFLLAREIYR